MTNESPKLIDVNAIEENAGFQVRSNRSHPCTRQESARPKTLRLAREGITARRSPLKVTIYELQIIKNGVRDPKSEIGMRVVCSVGTYIRTLAEDIGRRLGVGAHLLELRRTRAGKFSIRESISLPELEAAGDPFAFLIPVEEAISPYRLWP